MSSACKSLALVLLLGVATSAPAADLRVCADPDNMPFSNAKGEGFENALAQLIARDLHRTLHYVWFPQRRGFVRNTLKADRCDLIIGIPTNYELALATRPYYRSTYVFVTRHDRHLNVRSFDDPILRKLRIGIHAIGDDYANVPPAHALAARGIVRNIVGYTIYGEAHPPSKLIDAVAKGDVDVAIAWGPLAGYFASREPVKLDVVPVSPQIDLPFLPFVFDISMGVRHGDSVMKAALDSVIERREGEIHALLERYRVPLVDGGS